MASRQQLEDLLRQLLGQDVNQGSDSIQKAQHILFNQLSTPQNIPHLIKGLVEILRQTQQTELRTLAAVVLRQKLPIGDTPLIRELPAALQILVKRELLAVIVHESDKSIKRLVSSCIAQVGRQMLFRGEWPELLPFIFKCMAGPSETAANCVQLQAGGFQLFGLLTADCDTGFLKDHIERSAEYFNAGLNSSDPGVRIEASISLIDTVVNLWSDDANRDLWRDFLRKVITLVPKVLQTLTVCCQHRQLQAALTLMKSLTKLVSSDCARLLRESLGQICSILHKVAASTGPRSSPDKQGLPPMPENLRTLALEGLISSFEQDTSFVMRSAPQFLTMLTQLCLQMMCEVEDFDTEEWNSTPDDDESSAAEIGTAVNDVAEFTLDRMVAILEADQLVPLVLPHIQKGVQSENWKVRHASLRALMTVAELMAYDQLPINPLIKVVASDSHPAIRHSAIACLGQIALDFESECIGTHTDTIVPSLLSSMKQDFKANPRVAAYAASAMLNILQSCQPSHLQRWIEPLHSTLIPLLMSRNPMLQQAVLPSFAALSTVVPDIFQAKFYSVVMPPIMHIINHAQGHQTIMLWARAIEAATAIGEALGDHHSKKDAIATTQILLKALKRSLESSESSILRAFILPAFVRLCQTLGDEFANCFPILVPILCKFAGSKLQELSGLQSQAQYQHFTKADDDEDRMTGDLEHKIQAILTLTAILHEFRNSSSSKFREFFPQIAETLLVAINFKSNSDVRGFSLANVASILDYVEYAHPAKALNSNTVDKLFEAITGSLAECLQDEHLMDNIYALSEAITRLGSSSLTNKIPAASLNRLLMTICRRLEQLSARLGKLYEKQESVQDEFGADSLYHEVISFESMLDGIGDSLGQLVKGNPDTFLQHSSATLMPVLIGMVSSGEDKGLTTIAQKRTAVFVLDDLVEHLGSRFFPAYQTLMPLFIQLLDSPDRNLRQGAAYGLSMAAVNAGPKFGPWIEPAARALNHSIQQPASRQDSKNWSATDNMIAALGNIGVYAQSNPSLKMWLSCLPFPGQDEEECRKQSELLVKLLQTQNSPLLGGPDRGSRIALASALLHLVYLQPEILTPSLLGIYDDDEDEDEGKSNSGPENPGQGPLLEVLEVLRHLPKDILQSAMSQASTELKAAMQRSGHRL